MNRIQYFYLGILLVLVSCDSFPKRMHSEKMNSPSSKDNIKISAECSERANQFPFPEFKNFITVKLYIVNSSVSPIEFAPAELVMPEQSGVEFESASGGREAAKKTGLRQKRTIIVGAGEDYLIDLHFGVKGEDQLQKATFKISGISTEKQMRLAELVTCEPLRDR